MCKKRRCAKEATQEKVSAGVVTRTPDLLTKKGKKLGPVSVFRKPRLEKFYFVL